MVVIEIKTNSLKHVMDEDGLVLKQGGPFGKDSGRGQALLKAYVPDCLDCPFIRMTDSWAGASAGFVEYTRRWACRGKSVDVSVDCVRYELDSMPTAFSVDHEEYGSW